MDPDWVFREDFLLFYCHRLTTLDQEEGRVACHKKSWENIVKREDRTEQQPLLSYGIVAVGIILVKKFLFVFIPCWIDIVFTSEKNRLNYLAGGPISNIWPHITWCASSLNLVSHYWFFAQNHSKIDRRFVLFLFRAKVFVKYRITADIFIISTSPITLSYGFKSCWWVNVVNKQSNKQTNHFREVQFFRQPTALHLGLLSQKMNANSNL